ncbi:monocyte chemotactic protein 1B-like [Alosa sapidissima]|uniref:monocyte chemotactic protein 1B-like n=1 Tax=Alosa sapidissima TaxID=34773 RepID=UPI001C08A200|nr:monocyte chemotactic protein 1B-like [Alosa sapidissima]
MRTLMIPLCLLMLLISEKLISCAPPHVTTPQCCTHCLPPSVKIPVLRVVSYRTTNNSCYTKAYVFKTKAGKEICVNPDLPWVNRIVKKLKKPVWASINKHQQH